MQISNCNLTTNLQPAGKIQNLRQVCDVSGLVILMTRNIRFHNCHPISLHIHSVPGIKRKCFCTLHIYLSTLDSCKMVGKGGVWITYSRFTAVKKKTVSQLLKKTASNFIYFTVFLQIHIMFHETIDSYYSLIFFQYFNPLMCIDH